MTTRIISSAGILAGFFSTLIFAATASATTYTWDVRTGQGNGTADGSGTWDIATPNWWSGGTSDTTWTTTGTDTAQFGSGSGGSQSKYTRRMF